MLLGCGSKGAVSLTVDIPTASVQVLNGPFGASLKGQFELGFALGPESSGATTVSSGSFSLESEAQAALGGPLTITETSPSFPLTIEPGTSKSMTLKYKLESGVQLTDFCAAPAPRVSVVGAVMDTLKGGADPVSSRLFSADCPPAI